MKRIKKVSQVTPVSAEVVDGPSQSTKDAYSCNYVNTLLNSRPKIVFTGRTGADTVQSLQYTFGSTANDSGLYLVMAHTNGGNSAIVDLVSIDQGELNKTRIAEGANHYATITYSGFTVTMTRVQYSTKYSIVKMS